TQRHTFSLHDALPISRSRGHSAILLNRIGFPNLPLSMSISNSRIDGTKDQLKPIAKNLPVLSRVFIIGERSAGLAVIGFSHNTRSEEHTSELQSRFDL